VQQYFVQEDVEEILKIQTSRRNDNDFIAWHPEKRGIFTVKSAYRLALNASMQHQDIGATSARPDGMRPGWKVIWKCQVPPKVKILAWKICCNAISTQTNLERRGMATLRLCQVCGMEDEDSFHAFMRCPHARQLWLAMAEIWPLPRDELLVHTGKEWLLHLLLSIPEAQRAPTLMTIWRIWHAHNEVTHDKPCPPIEGSRRFLVSYLNSLMMIKQFPDADITKGKMVVDTSQGFKRVPTDADGRQKERKRWLPPDQGAAKLNVDGAFASDGAGAGMVLRDHTGEVIFTACRQIVHCRDAMEAEIKAIEEGLRLALHWTNLDLQIESDCAEAVELIKDSTPNTSVYAFSITTIRELLRERESSLAKINREANVVSHELAKLGRMQGRTEFWLRDYPREVAVAVASDCNPTYI
jgi:ribonuclease HI